MQQYALQPSRTAMIGDRLDTDIAMGKQGDLVTLLPLTGECEGVCVTHFCLSRVGGQGGQLQPATTAASADCSPACALLGRLTQMSCAADTHMWSTLSFSTHRITHCGKCSVSSYCCCCCCCAAARAGVTTLQEAMAAPPAAAPDFILDSVASLAGL
jgi:hypothetical protein